MHRLTPRQRSILDFIVDRVDSQAIPPSLKEIAAEFGLRSVTGIVDHLNAIERKGYIRRRSGVSRGIVILRHPKVSTSRGDTPGRVPVIGEVPGSLARLRRRQASGYVDFAHRLVTSKTFAVRLGVSGLEHRGLLAGDALLVDPASRPSSGDLSLAHDDSATTLIEHRSENLVSLVAQRRGMQVVKILGRVSAVTRELPKKE